MTDDQSRIGHWRSMVLQPIIPVPRVDHGAFPLHIQTLRAVTQLVAHTGHAHLQLVNFPTSIIQFPLLMSKPILVLVQSSLNVPSMRSLIVEESLELQFQSLHLGFQGHHLKLSLVSLLTIL